LLYEQTGQYNGNIGEMQWKITQKGSNTSAQGYRYTYDALSRLKSATYRSFLKNDHLNVSNLQYDANGNIRSLNRSQFVNNGVRVIDKLSYSYTGGGNQLQGVTDIGDTGAFTDSSNPKIAKYKDLGFRDGNTIGEDYQYDANGNMVADHNKDIDQITYNHLNLPIRVTKDNGDYVEYTYNAAGIKLSKTAKSGNATTVSDYVGGKHYVNDALTFFLHAEGRVVKNGTDWDTEFHLTDHLGNVRVTVNEQGDVIQRQGFYPFGGSFNEWKGTNPENKYTYNGVEFDVPTGMFETLFRGYDPYLGRFAQIDPLADIIPGISTYHFGFNNPVRYADPEGLMGRGKAERRRRKAARKQDKLAKRNKKKQAKFSKNKLYKVGTFGGISKHKLRVSNQKSKKLPVSPTPTPKLRRLFSILHLTGLSDFPSLGVPSIDVVFSPVSYNPPSIPLNSTNISNTGPNPGDFEIVSARFENTTANPQNKSELVNKLMDVYSNLKAAPNLMVWIIARTPDSRKTRFDKWTNGLVKQTVLTNRADSVFHILDSLGVPQNQMDIDPNHQFGEDGVRKAGFRLIYQQLIR